jgi:cyclic pyranopterin phosphate synthase
MTSNGTLVEKELDRLVEAGLDGLNISLDTLDGETFRRITRRNGLGKVLRAVDGALAAGLKVKINTVLLRGINDHELGAIAALARRRPVPVRYIELMPLGCAAAFEPLSGQETAAALERQYGKLVPLTGKLGNGPARYYRLEGFTGPIGFINPISRGFCESCNRLRLSSQGILRSCLCGGATLDLRSLLRSGEGALRQGFIDLAARKPPCHHLSGVYGKGRVEDGAGEMFRVGG